MRDNFAVHSALLTNLRLSDSNFPAGNFGFSNGLEAVLNSVDTIDQNNLTNIIRDLIEGRWKSSDCVALRKCYQAMHSISEIVEIDQELDSSSTSSVTRRGSANNGRALLSTAATLGDSRSKEYLALIKENNAIGHIPIAQALYWHHNGLTETEAIHLSFYSIVSNYCQVAVRLGAIGALQAQKTISILLREFSLTESGEFWQGFPSSFTPYSDIATLKLSQQEIRLFRN